MYSGRIGGGEDAAKGEKTRGGRYRKQQSVVQVIAFLGAVRGLSAEDALLGQCWVRCPD